MHTNVLPASIPVSRWGTLLRDARYPQDLPHRTMLRDTDPQLFETLRRQLALAGFRGGFESDGIDRSVWLRQGHSASTGFALLGSGCGGLLVSVSGAHLTPALVIASLALLAVGAWIASRTRRYITLVARPSGHGGTDVWIGGASSRDGEVFAAEFAVLVGEARRLHDESRVAMEAYDRQGDSRTHAA